MTSAIVGSVIANKPLNGGNAWVVLSWVLGLQRLGLNVHLIEQIKREHCVDAAGKRTAFENSMNLAYFKKVTAQFGLSATLVLEEDRQTYGLAFEDLVELANATELLLNISGHLTLAELVRPIRRRVYLDLDPGFTQFWYAAGQAQARLADHDFYFTIGENIGNPICSIPTCDVPWRPIRQPVVLDEWRQTPVSNAAPFTTVASWRGPYGRVEHKGKLYGLKVHEFRKFMELPKCTGEKFELALDIHPADQTDMSALQAHGWHVVEARRVAPDPATFRNYVQASAAEFSAAQGIYVETAGGWFSDRTVRYLASGKPALVQYTGFRRNLPVGDGLLGFSTLEEAITGAEQIAGDYERHCRAARAMAEEYFDSDKVLTNLLEQVDVAP